MQINHLSLTNFRNYSRLELDLPAGPTLVHGENAQGKTNLLEAIYYLATTRSPHADQDLQLINWDALQGQEPLVVGRLVAEVRTREGPCHLEMRLVREQNQGRNGLRREALVDRRKVRLMDLLGTLRVVLFVPQDMQIITGSPAGRRRYLDITLCQTDRSYCRALSTFNKVLEQRNALLKRIADEGTSLDVLPVYTDRLVEAGSQIFARRALFVAQLSRKAQRLHYEQLTDGRETLRLNYLPRLMEPSLSRGNSDALEESLELARWLEGDPGTSAIAERYLQVLRRAQAGELARGSTRIGPHRDDWRFEVGSRDLGTYGSRGQQRSALLALKLAEIGWMRDETGETPILLLDEVLAELDEQRRALLLRAVRDAPQAILTATDPGMFTHAFLQAATRMSVVGGRISVDAQADSAPAE
jgi:DNA replication and repair protein RecF